MINSKHPVHCASKMDWEENNIATSRSNAHTFVARAFLHIVIYNFVVPAGEIKNTWTGVMRERGREMHSNAAEGGGREELLRQSAPQAQRWGKKDSEPIAWCSMVLPLSSFSRSSFLSGPRSALCSDVRSLRNQLLCTQIHYSLYFKYNFAAYFRCTRCFYYFIA